MALGDVEDSDEVSDVDGVEDILIMRIMIKVFLSFYQFLIRSDQITTSLGLFGE